MYSMAFNDCTWSRYLLCIHMKEMTSFLVHVCSAFVNIVNSACENEKK